MVCGAQLAYAVAGAGAKRRTVRRTIDRIVFLRICEDGGIEPGLTTVYTYDEKDFRKIPGLEVRKP